MRRKRRNKWEYSRRQNARPNKSRRNAGRQLSFFPVTGEMRQYISHHVTRLRPGDKVRFVPKDFKWGIYVRGTLQSIDPGYRAYIYSSKAVPGTAIKRGDLVKVLLRDGAINKIS